MTTNLKFYRNANKLTQLQLGDLLGVSSSTISIVERGDRELPDLAVQLFNQL